MRVIMITLDEHSPLDIAAAACKFYPYRFDLVHEISR